MDSVLTIRCPSCARHLKLPEAAQGKNVKCPVCEAIFKVDAGGPPGAPPAVPDRGAIARRPPPDIPPPATSSRNWGYNDEDVGPPLRRPDDDDDRPRRRSRYDDDDDWDRPSRRRDYDDDDDWAPRRRSRYDDDYDDDRDFRRRKRREEDAIAKVAAPAIALIVLGFLELAASIFIMFLLAIPSQNRGDQEDKVVFMIIGLVGIFWSVLTLVGAFAMKSMRSYSLAMMACVMGLVPGTIFNLAVGIWAIVVMSDSEVKKAFARNAR